MDMPKSCFKCRCQKAAKISIEMSDLQRVVGDAEMAYERAGMLEVPRHYQTYQTEFYWNFATMQRKTYRISWMIFKKNLVTSKKLI